jgi:hypothetical protein
MIRFGSPISFCFQFEVHGKLSLHPLFFHNLVVKLLSRIIAPKITDDEGNLDKELHDHTYGIASDPLCQFAVVLSALIHDVGMSAIGKYSCCCRDCVLTM